MSDTPIVDELTGRYGAVYVVEVCDLARQLERGKRLAETQLAIAVGIFELFANHPVLDARGEKLAKLAKDTLAEIKALEESVR